MSVAAAVTLLTALAAVQTQPAASAPPVPQAPAAPHTPTGDAPAAAPASSGRKAPPLDGCRWIPEAPSSSGGVRFMVIDLWGPWSSESMTFMPRLSRIAREHAADGVSVRGITRESPAYPAERIEESVRRLGGRVTYPIGIAPPELHAQLAALSGEPAAADLLVTDSSGTLIASCTPAEVEHVIARLLAGTWTGPHEVDAIRRESRAMDSLVKVSMGDPALAASQVDEMIAMHPHRVRDFASRRIIILLRAGRADEAAAAMRAATEEWARLQDSVELTSLATIWMDSRTNSSGRDLQLAAHAAEAAALITGDLDPNPWLLLMRARVAAGDPAGARAAGERAMSMGDERMRGRVARLLAKIPQHPEGTSDGTGQRAQSP